MTHSQAGPVTGAWTEGEIALVKQRWNLDGASSSAIARETGRSRNSICGLIHRLRGEFKDRSALTPAGRAAAARARDDAAGEGGTGAGKRKARKPAWSDAEIAEARRLWAAGMAQREMAERLGKGLMVLRALIEGHRDWFPARAATERARPVKLPAPVVPLPAIPGLARDGAGQPKRRAAIPAPGCGTAWEPVTLVTRSADQCAYPLWDSFAEKPDAGSFYCGAATGFSAKDGPRGKTVKRDAYCAFHRRLMTAREADAA